MAPLLAAATCGFVWRDPTPRAPFKGALALTGKAQSSEFSCFLFNLIGLPRRQFRRSTLLASISPDPGRGGPRRDALYPGERRLGGYDKHYRPVVVFHFAENYMYLVNKT